MSVAGPLYDALTQQLALPRMTLAPGGAVVVHREAIKRAAKLLRAAVFAGGGAASPLGSAWSRLQEAAVVDDIHERVARGAGHGQ